MSTPSPAPQHLAWSGLDRFDDLLGGTIAEGDYLTFAVATTGAGERTVAQRELAPTSTVAPWVVDLLDEHGAKPDLDRCRLRRWARGGRPTGGVVLRPMAGAAAATGTTRALAPGREAPVASPSPDRLHRVTREHAAFRARVRSLTDEVARLERKLATAEGLRRRVDELEAERRELRRELAERDAVETRAARLIEHLRAQNQELGQGVVRLNEMLGELGL